MHSLRSRGTAALSEPECRARLSELNDPQMLMIAERLQTLPPAWTAEQVDKLFATKAQL